MAFLGNNTEAVNGTGKEIASTQCFANDASAVVVVRVLLYCVIILTSSIGNCVIIRLVKKEGRSRNSTSLFIANMSVCALLLTVVYMPRVIALYVVGYAWQVTGILGLILCKCVIFLDYVGVAVCVLTVMVISVERCIAVTLPYKAIFTTRFSKLVVASIWFVAVSTQWPFVYDTYLIFQKDVPYCFIDHDRAFGKGAKQVYYNFNLIAMYTIPLSVTTIAYTVTVVKLKRMKKPGAATVSSSREQRNRRVVYMVLTVVTLFVMCWLLYFIYLVLYAYSIHVQCEVLFLRLFFAHLNCAITPYLYTKFSARYRRAFIAIVAPFCLCFCREKLKKAEGEANQSQLYTLRNAASPRPSSSARNTASRASQPRSSSDACLRPGTAESYNDVYI